MIDYLRLAKSVEFYECVGFTRIESPWTVTRGISDITRPPDAKDFALIHEDEKVLVASGEQSFLYLYNKGFIPKGRFQTITPCFRKEKFGPVHTKYFIKNELIDTVDVTTTALDRMVGDAQLFFAQYTSAYDIEVVSTGVNSYDLNIAGVEVGSYGIRSCDYLDWVYGTGVAEPRMTKALEKLRRQK